MGIRFNPDEPSGRARPGLLARAWSSFRSPPTAPTTPAPTTTTTTAPAQARLTAAEVSAVRFRPSAFREGYDQTEVDDFLDRVESTLRERAAGRPGTLTAAEVVNVVFSATRLRQGYDQGEVDEFLDRVVQALA